MFKVFHAAAETIQRPCKTHRVKGLSCFPYFALQNLKVENPSSEKSEKGYHPF